MNLNVYLEVLIALVITYVVLTVVTFYTSNKHIEISGHVLPNSFEFVYWFTSGPAIIVFIGLIFGLVSTVLLSPFVFFYFGFKWLALTCLIAEGVFACYSPVRLDYRILKFPFPLSLLISVIAYWLFGLTFLIIGALFLSPIIFLIFV